MSTNNYNLRHIMKKILKIYYRKFYMIILNKGYRCPEKNNHTLLVRNLGTDSQKM